MKKSIIINGKGGSGKDTFIRICEMLIHEPVYSFTSVSVIKKAAKFLGWTGTKTNKDRKFLSDLKALSISYNDQPNDYLIYSLNRTESNSLNFFHIREIEEINKFINTVRAEKINTEIYTLLLIRNDDDLGNDSDNKVNDINYDFTIYNNYDIFELYLKVLDFLSKLGIRTSYDSINI